MSPWNPREPSDRVDDETDLVEIEIIVVPDDDDPIFDRHWSDRYCGGEIW